MTDNASSTPFPFTLVTLSLPRLAYLPQSTASASQVPPSLSSPLPIECSFLFYSYLLADTSQSQLATSLPSFVFLECSFGAVILFRGLSFVVLFAV
jgi:hypothetical protein